MLLLLLLLLVVAGCWLCCAGVAVGGFTEITCTLLHTYVQQTNKFRHRGFLISRAATFFQDPWAILARTRCTEQCFTHTPVALEALLRRTGAKLSFRKTLFRMWRICGLINALNGFKKNTHTLLYTGGIDAQTHAGRDPGHLIDGRGNLLDCNQTLYTRANWLVSVRIREGKKHPTPDDTLHKLHQLAAATSRSNETNE